MGLDIIKAIFKLFPRPLAKCYILHSPFPVGKKFLLAGVDKKYTTNTIYGSKMHGRINDDLQGYIYYFGIWEPDITHFIKNRLDGQINRTFIDVGANIGYFTLLAAQCMPQGQVVSIEAFPSIFHKLEENIKINDYKNIRAVNCAATDSRHPVQMFCGFYECHTSSRKTKLVIDTPQIVEGFPLSEILTHPEIITTRLIKIDVEGAECEVLKGIYPILHQFPNDIEFVVEITPSLLRAEEISGIFDLFEEEGFFPYQLVNSYDIEYYKFYKETNMPARVRTLPNDQVDIVFSRIDREYLGKI